MKLNEFRQISLIGCMYKVLAKILANILRKSGLESNIRNSTFFFGWTSKLGCILIENEVVDNAKRGVKKFRCLKLILKRHMIRWIGIFLIT